MEVVSNRSQKAPSHRSVAKASDAAKSNAPVAAPTAAPADAPPASSATGGNPASRSVSVFDPQKHRPPRIDQFGYNKETHKGRELLNRNAKNVLSQPVRVPQWWHSKTIREPPGRPGHVKHSSVLPVGTDGEAAEKLAPSAGSRLRSQSIAALPEKRTLTKLLEARKKEILPDLSYDLDGDGFVGGRDYVVARRFDEGHKNYLTEEELAKVRKALAEGYEEQFVWGVEASGAQRPYRILQKRGVFVDGDDYLGVTDTYPKHPIGENKPKLAT